MGADLGRILGGINNSIAAFEAEPNVEKKKELVTQISSNIVSVIQELGKTEITPAGMLAFQAVMNRWTAATEKFSDQSDKFAEANRKVTEAIRNIQA